MIVSKLQDARRLAAGPSEMLACRRRPLLFGDPAWGGFCLTDEWLLTHARLLAGRHATLLAPRLGPLLPVLEIPGAGESFLGVLAPAGGRTLFALAHHTSQGGPLAPSPVGRLSAACSATSDQLDRILDAARRSAGTAADEAVTSTLTRARFAQALGTLARPG